MATIEIFDASLQRDVPHELSVNPENGEIVATSTESDRSIKFAAGLNAGQIRGLLVKHKQANEGQVTVEESFSVLDELVATEPEQTPDEVVDSESIEEPNGDNTSPESEQSNAQPNSEPDPEPTPDPQP